MILEVKGGEISDGEKEQYKAFVLDKYKDCIVDKVVIELDGEFANVTSFIKPIAFERVRRITGYLVGTLDRFNDAKLAEVKDRTPNGVGYDDHTVSGLIDN